MTAEIGGVLSVDELLARAKAAADAKRAGQNSGKSTIQQIIAQMESKLDLDSVNLSPVARLLKRQAAAETKTATPYTEQEWFIQAKVAQLRGQIELYSNLPGLDPSGAMMQSLEDEVRALVGKQQAKIRASQAEAAKKSEELRKQEAEKAAAPMSADEMLRRSENAARGIAEATPVSKEAQALLDKVRKSVNTTA